MRYLPVARKSGLPGSRVDAYRAGMTIAVCIDDLLVGLDWRGNLGLPNRSLMADLAARHHLAGMLRQLRPRTLLAPYWEDAHPDHVTASALVDAARFWAKLTKTDLPGGPHYPQRILYYFSVHLRLHSKPSFVVDISPHIETKMQSIACYQSQFI